MAAPETGTWAVAAAGLGATEDTHFCVARKRFTSAPASRLLQAKASMPVVENVNPPSVTSFVVIVWAVAVVPLS